MNRPDCFSLALIELNREGNIDKMKPKEFAGKFIDRAIKIRDYLINYEWARKRAMKRWEKRK